MASFHNYSGMTSLVATLFLIGTILQDDMVSATPYHGKRIGALRSYAHGVSGDVYAATDTSLYITGFYYDGLSPDAFVWMGSTPSASGQGTVIPVNGSSNKLGSYNDEVVRLDLPGTTALDDYKWISIWCRRFSANFGDLEFPQNVAPVPVSLGTLGFSPYRVHNVWAEDAIVLNNRQIQLVNLDYDGNGPDAYYWAGSGGTPSAGGFALADESRGGSLAKLPRQSFNDKTVTLTVPADRGDIFNIGHVGLWCVRFTQDFGHVDIPNTLEVPVYDDSQSPPTRPTPIPTRAAPVPVSLGTLGFSPYRVHNVWAEDVIVLNNRQIQLVNLDYDGNGPDAYYWAGSGGTPSAGGFALADESRGGSLAKLTRQSFNDKTVTLTIPANRGDISSIGYVGLWCVAFTQDFGHVDIPSSLEVPIYDDYPSTTPDLLTTRAPPVPVSLGTLGFVRRVHNVWAEDVIVLNNRQIQLVDLDYDGNGPDTYYWAGSGSTPSSSGFALADESRGGSLDKLPRQRFNDKTVTLTIPANRGDISSIGYVGLWCVRFTEDFGHVDIPSSLDVPDYDDTQSTTSAPTQSSESCQVLIDDTYQVRWTLTDSSSIKISLSARINPGTYMAFGLSGSESRTLMVGSDVTVAWLDAETGATANVVDYYLSAYQQCVIASGSGACTDELTNPSGNNDVILDEYSNENGIITISYTKPLNTGDIITDKVIPIDRDVYVSWSIGPINPAGLVARHRQQPSTDVLFNFGQTGLTCPDFTFGETDTLEAWVIPTIPGDITKTEFQVDIGQAGGQQGYEGITGAPGWGIAWYVDEYIIPVLTLKRHVTYTFTVQGGNDVDIQARYHPFYITNDEVGGYFQKTEQERQGIEIYAGPVNGSLCEWRSRGSYNADDFDTFVNYRDSSLERACDEPIETATLTWTPDENTPDRVYYQCYTHKFLGWKIDIIDNDDIDECASNIDNCDDVNGACTNTLGSYTCSCNDGFNGDGITCNDIDECASSTNNCDDVNGVCTNTLGSFTCSCNEGFNGDGITCNDIDECTSKTDNCDDVNGVCTNILGSFICSCNDGFNGDGITCNDIDECAVYTDNCDNVNGACMNTLGSFTCSCNDGFNGDGITCNDIDECAANTDNCNDVNGACTNTLGSFTCSCNEGFNGDGITCNVREFDQSSTYLDGNLLLHASYAMDSDIFLCSQTQQESDPWWRVRLEQEYQITQIITKLNRRKVDLKAALQGAEYRVGSYTTNNGLSSYNTLCGTVTRGQATGAGDIVITCPDGTYGQYLFINNPGIDKTIALCEVELTISEDVNECTSSSPCDNNAACANTDGSFTCTCNDGWTGNGLYCIDVNECTTSNPCDINADCYNGDGSYVCICNNGWTGNGFSCTDVNECTTSPLCDSNAACVNNDGSFTCTCNDGWIGDGSSCTDVTPNQPCSDMPCSDDFICLHDDTLHACLPKIFFEDYCPCRNEGMCSEDEGGLGVYCVCPDGYFGIICEQGDSAGDVPPVITGCPDDISTTALSGDSRAIVSWNEPIGQDDSGTVSSVTRSHIPGSSFSIGTTFVEYTFADGAGNRAACQFNVTVIGASPNIIGCPQNIDVDLGAGPMRSVQWQEPVATDSQGRYITGIRTHSPFSTFPIGETTVEYVFTDDHGNTAVCSFIIAVADTTSPEVIDCPANIERTLALDGTTIQVTWTPPTAIDNSYLSIDITQSHTPGSSFAIGTTTVNYSFTDVANNAAVCVFNVTINKYVTPDHPCSNMPCSDDSICLFDDSLYACLPKIFFENYCPCRNEGMCSEDEGGLGIYCACPDGYSGIICEQGGGAR